MYKRSFNGRDAFQYILEGFTKIVCISKTYFFIQYNINLNIQLIPCMISLKSLDLPYSFRKSHCQIQQHVSLVSRCGSS